MTRRILLDCDPGVDDALALMLAAGSEAVELAAITTVGGNQSLEKVTVNALALADLLGLDDVPIAAGAADPLIRPIRSAAEIHGDSGLGRVEFHAPRHALDERHAVELLAQELEAAEAGELTLIATGPLTNLALLVRQHPRLVEKVREVVLMGGGVHTGNVTAVAEFNVAVDPEAARIVFRAGWPVTMVGLDTTHQALATPEVEDSFARLGTPAGDVAVELIRSYRDAYQGNQSFKNPPCHDPVAVARVIDPDLVPVRRAPIDVELSGELTAGMTVVDLRSPEGAVDPDATPTFFATGLDAPRFWQLCAEAVAALGGTR